MIIKNANHRPLDLVLLKTFVQVIDSQSFTWAAEELHLAQSTVSAHIKRLETFVGSALLEKHQRMPEPTLAGRKLLVHARRLLNQNTLAWQDLCDHRLEGTIRLGIPDDYLVYIPSMLSNFEKRFPDVELQVHCGLSVELLDKLHANTLDLAITTRQPYTPGGTVLYHEKTVWAAAEGFDINKRAELPLALSRDGMCIFRQRGIEALNSAGIRWRAAYTSASLSGLSSVVKAGLAVTILTPSMLVPGMVTLNADIGLPDLPSTEIALHRHPFAKDNPIVDELVDCFHQLKPLYNVKTLC